MNLVFENLTFETWKFHFRNSKFLLSKFKNLNFEIQYRILDYFAITWNILCNHFHPIYIQTCSIMFSKNILSEFPSRRSSKQNLKIMIPSRNDEMSIRANDQKEFFTQISHSSTNSSYDETLESPDASFSHTLEFTKKCSSITILNKLIKKLRHNIWDIIIIIVIIYFEADSKK